MWKVSAKYLSLPNFDHLENSVGEIKESLADLENILQQNAPHHDFIDNIKCRELSSENKLLKLKITALEKQLYDKNQRIKMLEKLVLETHLWWHNWNKTKAISFFWTFKTIST